MFWMICLCTQKTWFNGNQTGCTKNWKIITRVHQKSLILRPLGLLCVGNNGHKCINGEYRLPRSVHQQFLLTRSGRFSLHVQPGLDCSGDHLKYRQQTETHRTTKDTLGIRQPKKEIFISTAAKNPSVGAGLSICGQTPTINELQFGNRIKNMQIF